MKFFLLLVTSCLTLVLIIGFWSITSSGYDRQNKLILTLKEIIPSDLAREVRDVIFFIPNLKNRNEFLSLQVEKYEQGLNGQLFKEKEKIKSNKNIEFEISEFFLPFPRLDTRLGWAATENSKRAHYLEVLNDKVLVISGIGQTIFFDKKNIFSKQLNQNNIPNNLSSYLKKNNYKLIGIRDLFVNDDYVYISVQHKDDKGFTINVYRSKLNYEKLSFEPFFITNEYWPRYNVFSGGRLEKYKENEILFSIGFSGVKNAAQNKDSLLGKIISINQITSKHKIISTGHRNPQGLFYEKSKDLIINTEHGPKGGDEVNLNFIKKNSIPNYGWAIASYGVPYTAKDTFKKSHSKHGFVEPFKYYTPSIGISEVVNLVPNKKLNRNFNTLYVSSLRAGSIYIIETDKEIKKIIKEDRLYFNEQRLRDIEYDSELDVFFILFEYTPSIGILKYSS